MKLFTSILTTSGFVILSAASAYAAWDQYGFPAKCSIYSACENGVCVRVHVPNSMFLFEESNRYSIATSPTDERHKLGYFNTLEDARQSATNNDERDFGHVVVPNNEIADAFGMNIHDVVSRGDETFVSDDMVKLVCSATRLNEDAN